MILMVIVDNMTNIPTITYPMKMADPLLFPSMTITTNPIISLLSTVAHPKNSPEQPLLTIILTNTVAHPANYFGFLPLAISLTYVLCRTSRHQSKVVPIPGGVIDVELNSFFYIFTFYDAIASVQCPISRPWYTLLTPWSGK